MRRTRKYYKELFSQYPDVVTVRQLRDMIGIGDKLARSLIHDEKLKAFYVRTTFFIPKKCVIDYVLSKDYQNRHLKARV